jgi:hypothetical protein
MKAILLVRVSTQKQDFDAQESEWKIQCKLPLKPSDSAPLKHSTMPP